MVAAYISKKGPYSQISDSFGRLYGWIGEKGYVPSGPPHGVYFNTPGQVPESELSWELGSPIAGDVAPFGPDDEGLGMKKVEAWIKGPGAGREAAIRSLKSAGLEVTGVKDVTPVPHNGCRQRKRRRV